MRATKLVRAAMVAGGVLFAPPIAFAQDDPLALRQEIEQLRRDFDALTQQYGDRLTALESRLAAMGGQTGAQTAAAPTAAAAPTPAVPTPVTADPPGGAAGAGGSAGSVPVSGAPSRASSIFNPDMTVIGNATGAAGINRVNPEPALLLREAEVSLQAVVDPYARADFFITVGPEGAGLEEGYITFPTLPGGVLMKVGKMKAAFGKVNTLHPHLLPWVDRPLAMNLLGGEEGINDSGVSVARLIPNPWVFLEATAQVFRGESQGVFQSSDRRDLSYVGRLRGYQDITESTNLDLGVSYARGRNPSGFVNDIDVGRFTTGLFGIDATFRWRPLRRSIYQSFLGRSEVIWSRRDQPSGLQGGIGFYVSGDYQVGRRWFAGVRIDRSVDPADVSLVDVGRSATLTFRPSEFSQVRAQYRRTNYGTGPSLVSSANELLFQVQFAIGAHGAHPF